MNPIVQEMLAAQAGQDVELRFLEDLLENEVKCQGNHQVLPCTFKVVALLFTECQGSGIFKCANGIRYSRNFMAKGGQVHSLQEPCLRLLDNPPDLTKGTNMTETGLPKLPDEYFWRVRHRKYQPIPRYDFVNTDTTRLQVQLIHKYTVNRPRWVQRRNWLGRKKLITEYYDDVVENAVFTEDAQGTNKIAVQNAANRIMKLWEKAKVRDELLGDFPPKSLEN